jgi:hypothetical protein
LADRHWSWIFSRVPCGGPGDSPAERRRWREQIYAEIRSRARTQGGLTLQRMCELVGVSRASFYRSWEQQEPTAAEMAVRDAIQGAAMAHRYYGYRRITEVLRRALGILRRSYEHEPARLSVGKRQMRKFHEDVETRGIGSSAVSYHRRIAWVCYRVHRANLQCEATAFGLGISITDGVREASQITTSVEASHIEFFEA